MAKNRAFSSIWRVYWLLLQDIEFYAIDTTSFLKNFVALKFLFIFDDLFKFYFSIVLLQLKKLFESRKVFIESFFIKSY